MQKRQYFTADEAVAELGVSKATLYSYVSRGFVRSEEANGKTRAKRYLAEDIRALKQRKEQRRNPAKAAAAALHFGGPVLESAITLIDNGHLYYRGHDAVALARQSTFEAVAALLWTGELARHNLFTLSAEDAAKDNTKDDDNIYARYAHLTTHLTALSPFEAFQVLLLLTAVDDLAAYNLAPDAVARTGVRLLHLMTSVITHHSPAVSIAHTLQQHWIPDAPDAVSLLDCILILCADHELNVSAFTARCVASAGATPYAAVQAGLAALQGPKHGGATQRVAALFRDASGNARRAVVDRLRQGEAIPGFGHPLYADGDPRGRLLIELAHQYDPGAPSNMTSAEIVKTVADSVGLQPNLDFGLVTLTRTMGLPVDAPLTLFALGRTAGWIGHIIEQYATAELIRPRAKYIP